MKKGKERKRRKGKERKEKKERKRKRKGLDRNFDQKTFETKILDLFLLQNHLLGND